ncbi:hypothetical protein ACVGW3_00080, partial [Enterobacter hormaechei]
FRTSIWTVRSRSLKSFCRNPNQNPTAPGGCSIQNGTRAPTPQKKNPKNKKPRENPQQTPPPKKKNLILKKKTYHQKKKNFKTQVAE